MTFRPADLGRFTLSVVAALTVAVVMVSAAVPIVPIA